MHQQILAFLRWAVAGLSEVVAGRVVLSPLSHHFFPHDSKTRPTSDHPTAPIAPRRRPVPTVSLNPRNLHQPGRSRKRHHLPPDHRPAGATITATSSSRAPRRPRIRSRAPPPTPIRTARGARSAAADELVLAQFLEASQRVPDLTLPLKKKRFDFPAPPPAPDIPAQDLLSGEAAAARTAIGAASEAGAFRVGGAIGAGEVRAAVEAAETVFGAPEEVKREMGRLFRRRDRVVGEELYLPWPVSSDVHRLLEAALPGSTYRAFREKMDVVASKMEDLARCVVRVLSDNVKNPRDAALPREAPSVLCLTLYNCNKLKTSWGEFGSTDRPSSYALSVHLSGRDQEICLRNQSGSTFFNLPAGSLLVTVGKQIQEWSNGEFKSAVGEILFELTDEPNPFMSLELLYSPGDLHLGDAGRHASRIDRPKTVPLRDQILIALVLLILYYIFWR